MAMESLELLTLPRPLGISPPDSMEEARSEPASMEPAPRPPAPYTLREGSALGFLDLGF